MTHSPASQALAAIERVLPRQRPLALHEPTFSGREWMYTKDCLDTGWVSTAGAYVGRFESELASCCGVDYAIATVNGTAALHACLMIASVGPGDEVIVPALTFVATANAVAYCGAVPHFADVEPTTLGLDPTALARRLEAIATTRDGLSVNRETGRVIRAAIVMHTFGHPALVDALAEVCRTFHIALIEDAAEALGSLRAGRHVGGAGLAASLSFNGNKVVTTGGGGAVLVRDAELARRIKHLTTTARIAAGWNFDHDVVGYNYRMPNINAALGCAQLEQLPAFIAQKRQLATRYRVALGEVPGVRFVEEPDDTASNYWLCALLFDAPAERDVFLRESNARGLQTRPPWRPMHRLPMYKDCPSANLSVTEDLADRLVNIPSSSGLASL